MELRNQDAHLFHAAVGVVFGASCPSAQDLLFFGSSIGEAAR